MYGILGIIGNYEGIDTSDATATANDIMRDKTAYANGLKLIGTLDMSNVKVDVQVCEGGYHMNQKIFNHNLGVVPDLIAIYNETFNGESITYALKMAIGLRDGVLKLGDADNYTRSFMRYTQDKISSYYTTGTASGSITDSTYSSSKVICNANENTFEFNGNGFSGGVQNKLQLRGKYYVVAMSGLPTSLPSET